MKPADRIEIISALAEKVSRMAPSQMNLVLNQFGISPATGFEQLGDDAGASLLTRLQDSDDQGLVGLFEYVFGDARHGILQTQPGSWEARRFHLFLSHVYEERKYVGEVKQALRNYAIDCFVAHDDIEPTTDWLREIETALRTCDAMVAFLHPTFHESNWTDHEIGYAMAMQVLIVALQFGVAPYGFMARRQGVRAEGMAFDDVARLLFGLLVRHELTRAKMAEALVAKLEDADSFKEASDTSKLLEQHVSTWTPELLRRVATAVSANSQVRGAFFVPERIQSIVEKARAASEGE